MNTIYYITLLTYLLITIKYTKLPVTDILKTPKQCKKKCCIKMPSEKYLMKLKSLCELEFLRLIIQVLIESFSYAKWLELSMVDFTN